METRIAPRKPRARLNAGDTVLANAQALNMKPVKNWFDAFAEVHHGYAEAQRTVETAEQTLAAEQARVAQLDADQDDAVETLAVCMVNDGEPRTNPFGRFGDQAPGTVKALPLEEEPKAIHTLVATLQRHKSLSPATLAAVQKAEEAARKVEAALPPLQARRAELKTARNVRDTIARQWDAHLGALRYAVRGASATTVPGLYAALFGRPGRPAKKTKGTADGPATTSTAPPPASAAPASLTRM